MIGSFHVFNFFLFFFVLHIYVKPRSPVNKIEHWKIYQGKYWLQIRVRACPIDGKANQAAIVLLAKELAIAHITIQLLSGFTSRYKTCKIEKSLPELAQKLPKVPVMLSLLTDQNLP